mmetsp:Transcript_41951/g.100803  ORF Transcript_41951/g.100803 Transcript_41951/m.100803 type:complete len:103 (+) Transcript_41951:332-640(+)
MYKQELLMDDMTGLELAFRSMRYGANANATSSKNNNRSSNRARVVTQSDEVDQDDGELALIEDDILSVGDVGEVDFDCFGGEDGLPRNNNNNIEQTTKRERK